MLFQTKVLGVSFTLILLAQSGVNAANILYLNSTRGQGTGGRGNFRSPIAQALDDYDDGSIFDVDFVQTHTTGNLASLLAAKPLDFYDQIWFDTTILNQSILNDADLGALNNWAANNQPEFILDSSFFFRNNVGSTLTDSAIAMTVNEALALDQVGGGIFLGTDHNVFANTANQVLENFGFDGFFTGIANITRNAEFVGNLLLHPETVDNSFFQTNLQGLSTSNVPVGKHALNENGGNRTVEVYENLYSFSPNKVSHIGATFNTGDNVTDPGDTENPVVPTPLAGIQALIMAVSGWFRKRKDNEVTG